MCNKDWTYEYHGKDWKCGCKGKMQSPCNIPSTTENPSTDENVSSVFSKIQLSYEETSM